MHELDLIPEDYRNFIFRLGLLKWSGVIAGSILFVSTSLYLSVWQYHLGTLENIAQIEKDLEFTSQEKQKISVLEGKQHLLNQHLKLLEALSGELSTQDLFRVVELALVDTDVWFERWNFERTREDVTGNKLARGYILSVPADEFHQQPANWRLGTNMTVVGKAKDHQTLSQFVRHLIAQPEIESVKVKRTSTSKVANRELVTFHLSIILSNRPRAA